MVIVVKDVVTIKKQLLVKCLVPDNIIERLPLTRLSIRDGFERFVY